MQKNMPAGGDMKDKKCRLKAENGRFCDVEQKRQKKE